MKKKAIIIGSGFGGLSLAIRLQAKGVQTVIYEKSSTVGGHASQIKEKGYTFDMGPSLITEPELLNDLFKISNKNMDDYFKLIELNPFYRIYFHDKTYIDYSANEDEMVEQIKKFNVHDAKEYRKFLKYSGKLYEEVITKKLGAKPFLTIWDMLRLLPKLVYLNGVLPSYFIVSRRFKDFRIRFLFSFHTLFIGGNPFRAPSLFLMLPYLERKSRVWFTNGGMYTVVQSLKEIYQELGGVIYTNAPVEQIIIEKKTAVGVKVLGKNEYADIVVSNAHFAHTYKDLIDQNERRKFSDRKIKKKEYSMSCVVIYLGVKKQYPQLKHHTLILSERYKELITDIFDRKIIPDDFSMYLHVPTRSDPKMAPEGCESMYILVPVANLLSGTNWESFGEEFSEKIINFLEKEFGLDELSKNIEYKSVFTPKDFESTRNNYQGAPWSLEPSLFQIATFRPHNRSEEFKNLYLVGVSTHPGGGVPGVMLSAEATMSLIVKDHELK